MNKAFKGGNVLWIVLGAIFLLSTSGVLFLMFQERGKRIAAEEQLVLTKKLQEALQLKLNNAQIELIQYKDQAQVLTEQLEEKEKNYQVALAEVDKIDAQLKGMESDLVNEKQQRSSLANALAQLRENYDGLEEKLLLAEQEAENLRGQSDQSTGRGGVELKKIVVAPKKDLTGKVLIVNREFHFVVIDLGREDGISVGDQFKIYQGSQEIGQVKIEKIYNAMSTAAILAGSQEQNISEDSSVKFF